jgi:adenosylcobinamide-GDP ribazoletransferase
MAFAWVAVACAALIACTPAHAGFVAMALSGWALGTLACARWLQRRLGGYTGDGLGATQQLTELLVLLGWLAAVRWTA